MDDDGFGASPVGRTPAGRTLDLLFHPPSPEQIRRAQRRGERVPTGGQMLCCRGRGEPPAEVEPLQDPLMPRLRTGDGFFDAEVSIRTRESLPWLMALDAEGRKAILTAVRAGWRCVGDDWVLPWSKDAELPEQALPAVDAAIDMLSTERTTGKQRFQATFEASDRALRRAHLALRGARVGWLPPERARALLDTEREPMVRLALYSLFLPTTVAEVSAGLRASDRELVGLSAVALAHTRPSGALREQVERALVALIDAPIEGLIVALGQVGGPLTMQALAPRVAAGGTWRGLRRDAGLELLESLQGEFSSPGAVALADDDAGAVAVVRPAGDDGATS